MTDARQPYTRPPPKGFRRISLSKKGGRARAPNVEWPGKTDAPALKRVSTSRQPEAVHPGRKDFRTDVKRAFDESGRVCGVGGGRRRDACGARRARVERGAADADGQARRTDSEEHTGAQRSTQFAALPVDELRLRLARRALRLLPRQAGQRPEDGFRQLGLGERRQAGEEDRATDDADGSHAQPQPGLRTRPRRDKLLHLPPRLDAPAVSADASARSLRPRAGPRRDADADSRAATVAADRPAGL